MSLLSHLSDLVGSAFSQLGFPAALGEVVPSQRPELAQFQCNGAMAAAKAAGRLPAEIAAEVVGILAANEDVAQVEVAPPGFVNINLTDDAVARWADLTATDDHLGFPPASAPERVVVDYAGPNVSKAMHVGHLRATIIGDSLARLFTFAGHHVTRDPHFGDWGFNMGVMIAAIAEEHPDLPYFDTEISEFPDDSPVTLDDLERIYPEAAARARAETTFADTAREATVRLQQGDPGYLALWRHMKTASEVAQREDFAALGVNFDLWYGESDVRERIAPMVASLIESGVTEESDGAVVIRVAKDEDKRDVPPLILESSAGGALYGTTDLATIQMRIEDLHADLVLYVVDKRQSDHFVQLFRAAQKAGMIPDGTQLEHIWFGTMNGPDGKPFKTREGGVVRLADVIEMLTDAARRRLDEAHLAEDYSAEEREQIASMVGIAALKFGDLINNRVSDYVFDLERFSSFEGKTGPYLQYAAVRIKSILRKAAEAGFGAGRIAPPGVDVERDLMVDLLRLPEVIQRAIDLRSPNHVAEFAYGVAGRFNRFYDACHILSETDPGKQASWLALSAWTLNALERLLDLLGIEIPDRM
ncbi:MAG TPA: arginine--tRNA ligase [Acidimicrobiia bacterium]